MGAIWYYHRCGKDKDSNAFRDGWFFLSDAPMAKSSEPSRNGHLTDRRVSLLVLYSGATEAAASYSRGQDPRPHRIRVYRVPEPGVRDLTRRGRVPPPLLRSRQPKTTPGVNSPEGIIFLLYTLGHEALVSR